jgi:extracellular elastinolytic metalloproteinase
MRSALLPAILVLSLAATAAAQDQPVAPDAAQATVFKAARGAPLTGPSTAPGLSIVADFVRAQGAAKATAQSLRVTAQERVARTGITHLRLEQEASGLRVANAYARATLNGRGELIQLIDALAPIPAAGVQPAHVDEARALSAALASLYPSLAYSPAAAARSGNVTTFQKTPFFLRGPAVERVAIAMQGGALKEGFEVETWTNEGNLLHYTLVAGNGRVVADELRTNTDEYNVFTEDPVKTPQALAINPAGPESPAGWLAGPQRSVNISGNNVHAYLDTDNDDAPDTGGTPITNGEFVTPADLSVEPGTGNNREVAIQNLFFLNNILHDTLYRHGFTEATGNFQENNFGNGGKDSDSVNAEGQDGGGTDNANFATPHDGQNPRMQMYLWTGKGDHEVVAGGNTYRAQGAAFGPALDSTGVTGNLLIAHDGVAGGTDTDGCETITTDLANSIAIIDRGFCNFTVKVKNAQNAGAVGAIIVNNAGDSIFTMGGSDSTITIPSVFVGTTDGTAIKGFENSQGTIKLTEPPPLHRDGDLDSDVVYHEYGHGLTWRMIGRMSGVMSGAIGEGMSDTLAIILNGDDRVGEYSFDDPLGIRRAPYTNYPLTYRFVTGGEVHNDGEVYGAIGWLLFQNYLGDGLTQSDVLDDIVDGMNYTPAGPRFEDMRDGILQSVAVNHPERECLVWDAFAHYGVGVGAVGKVRGNKITVTESFELPPECTP